MPKPITAQIGNLAPRAMVFEIPAGLREPNTITKLDDGSLILEAVPLLAECDMLYYGYEIPLDRLFGLSDDEYWDKEFVGRLTQGCAEFTLDQFEGLPITDGHTFVEAGFRDQIAIGTFLKDAAMDGLKVRSRALIYASTAIVKVSAQGSELSIGGMAIMEPNSRRGSEGEPDFFITRIELNHVALVEEGRAGPQARLLNHRANLAQVKEETQTMKITINGAEVEVPEVVFNHFSGQIAAVQTKLDAATTEQATLTNSVAALTTERDTTAGSLAVVQAELATVQAKVVTLENAKPDVSVEAARIANEHATFVVEAQRLGYTEELVLGAYDGVAIKRGVLNARGCTFADDASADLVNGGWNSALVYAKDSTTSVIDNRAPSDPFTGVIPPSMEETNNKRYFTVAKKEAN